MDNVWGNADKFKGRVLADSVAAKLENISALGQLDLNEVDEIAYDALNELGEEGGLAVVEQLAGSDLTHVQNKSAFLCGIIKTQREKAQHEQAGNAMAVSTQEQQHVQEGSPNEEKVRELLDRTGYSLNITVGQRKYGGPPPGWEGPPPPTGPSVRF